MNAYNRAMLDHILHSIASGEVDRATEMYTYEWSEGSVTWNITKVKQLIAQGRAEGWNEVPRDQLRRVAEVYEYDEATVARADLAVHGIAAPILDQGLVVYVIVDGIHRAVRAYRDGNTFLVLMLSKEDSRTCIIGPWEGLVP